MYQPQSEKTARVKRVVDGGYKVGGMTAPDDHAADAAMIKKAFSQHDSQLHGGEHTRLRLRDGGFASGGMATPRSDQRARGGKGKPRNQINVIVAGHPGGGAPPAPMMPPAMSPRPVIAPPPAPPPGAAGAPPGGGAPSGPPPMPGGLAGGPGMIPPGAPGPGALPRRPMIKTGGRTEMHAGAGSGEGRLEKQARLKGH